jgi:8-oxo-dGTP pyrophosphatase MutT (NUDIX family)
MGPVVSSSKGKRRFACFPVAILAFVVNDAEELLLLAHPDRGGAWEVINGALEAGETVLEGALRETREEAGPDVQVRPLGTAHVSSFHYDDQVRYMISLSYLLAYEGGTVHPGDDMAGSEFAWWGLDDLMRDDVELLVPPEKWVAARAVELYRLWRDSSEELQPPLD